MKVQLDSSELIRRRPFVCVYGEIGVGKSLDVARAFPNYLYLLTNPEALRPVEALRAKMQAEGAASETLPVVPTKRVIAPCTSDITNPDATFPIAGWFRDFISDFCKDSIAGKMSAGGLVIDEFSSLVDWIWTDLRRTHGKSFGTNDRMQDMIRWLAKVPSATNKALICVSHAAPPTYHDEGPNAGQLKYQGGPKMVMGSMIRMFCAETSATLHLMVEPSNDLDMSSEPKRFYATAANPLWMRKVRDPRVNAVEPIGLRALLEKCGFDLD